MWREFVQWWALVCQGPLLQRGSEHGGPGSATGSGPPGKSLQLPVRLCLLCREYRHRSLERLDSVMLEVFSTRWEKLHVEGPGTGWSRQSREREGSRARLPEDEPHPCQPSTALNLLLQPGAASLLEIEGSLCSRECH